MITIGCDPELMIEDRKNGHLKSAIPLLKGTKDVPQKVKGGYILADNVNLEFNTSPAKTAKQFVTSVRTVLQSSVKVVGDQYKLVVRASADFPDSELKDPSAKEFGCDPDYDAYEVCVNDVDPDAAAKTFRSAGGHIHIGYTDKTEELLTNFDGKLRVIRMMDAFVGIVSTFLDKDPTSKARRSLYGKAGCHRPKEYGVEYRAVGNYWVNSPRLTALMFDLTLKAVEICLESKDEELLSSINKDTLIDTINNCNVEKSVEIYNNFIKPLLHKKVSDEIDALNSIGSFNFYEEWKL